MIWFWASEYYTTSQHRLRDNITQHHNTGSTYTSAIWRKALRRQKDIAIYIIYIHLIGRVCWSIQCFLASDHCGLDKNWSSIIRSNPCNWFLNRTQNSVLLKCLQTSSVRGLAPNESVARKLRICTRTGDPPVINQPQMKEKKEAIPETNYKMEQTGNNVSPRH